MKASGRSLAVFYGSQTGTAEEFAGRLAKEGIRYQMKGMVADPEECDMVSAAEKHIFCTFLSHLNQLILFLSFRFVVKQEELLQLKDIPKSLAVFCLATYGEGDPTDNAMEFWEWIQGDVDLTGLNYAVSRMFQTNFTITQVVKNAFA